MTYVAAQGLRGHRARLRRPRGDLPPARAARGATPSSAGCRSPPTTTSTSSRRPRRLPRGGVERRRRRRARRQPPLPLRCSTALAGSEHAAAPDPPAVGRHRGVPRDLLRHAGRRGRGRPRARGDRRRGPRRRRAALRRRAATRTASARSRCCAGCWRGSIALHAHPSSVMFAANEPLQVEEIELADPGPARPGSQVEAAGVCHSDLHWMLGHASTPLPVVLGHEGCGIVESVGDGVTTVQPGDRCVLHPAARTAAAATTAPSAGRCSATAARTPTARCSTAPRASAG